MKIEKAIMVFLVLLPLLGRSQQTLKIISNTKEYEAIPKKEQLVLLSPYIKDFKTDLVYATNNNFVHQVLYNHPKVMVVLPMAKALQKAAIQLKKQGLGLLVYDAYRPYSVTEKMWQIVPDSRYAANPANGSDHNRGAAIDISLYNLVTGEPILMPTEFDNFTEKAHSNYMQLPQEAKEHREILRKTLTAVGLVQLATEWWHFTLPNARHYPILNLDFDTLSSLSK